MSSSDVIGTSVATQKLDVIYNYKKNGTVLKYDVPPPTYNPTKVITFQNFKVPNVEAGDTLVFNVPTMPTSIGSDTKMFIATWTWNGQKFNSNVTLFPGTVGRYKRYYTSLYLDQTWLSVLDGTLKDAIALWDLSTGTTAAGAQFKWKAVPDQVASKVFGPVNSNYVLEDQYVCDKGSIVTEVSGGYDSANSMDSGGYYVPTMKCSNGKVLNPKKFNFLPPDTTFNTSQCSNSSKGFKGIYGSSNGLKYGFVCGSSYPDTWKSTDPIPSANVTMTSLKTQFPTADSTLTSFSAPNGMAMTGLKTYYDKTNVGNTFAMQALYDYNPFDTVKLSELTLKTVINPPPPLKTSLSSFTSVASLPVLPDPPLPDFPVSSDPTSYYYATADTYKWQYPSANVNTFSSKETSSSDAQCPACSTCQVCPPKAAPPGHVSSDNFGVKSTAQQKVCPNGSYVSEIYGSKNSKNAITSIGMKCSDGTDLGIVGSRQSDDTDVSIKECDGSNGFSGIYGYAGSAGLLKVVPKCNNNSKTTTVTDFGRSATSGGGETIQAFEYNAPNGMVLSGFMSNNNNKYSSGSSIDNLQVFSTYNPKDVQNIDKLIGLPLKPITPIVVPSAKPLPISTVETYSVAKQRKNKNWFNFGKKKQTLNVKLIKPLPVLSDPPLPKFPVSEDPLKYYYSSPGTYKYQPAGGVLPQSMCPECSTCTKCGIVPKKISFDNNVQIYFAK